jgi:hypothetical protein
MDRLSKSISAQVDKMRADIQRYGESLVGCDELQLLRPGTSEKVAKIGIEQIAEWERWTFKYLPDGSVLFTPLSANSTDIAPSSDGKLR